MHAEILNKDQYKFWDEFAHNHPNTSIHQTTAWGRFQSTIPSRDKFWVIAIHDDSAVAASAKKKIIAGTLLIKHKLPRKNYCWLYSPRGPLLTYSSPQKAKEQMQILLEKIKEIARQEKAVFYRIDPLVIANAASVADPNQQPKKTFKFPGFRFSHQGFQPETTLILDISKSNEEILNQMKPKGRYNIRLAEKKGLKIIGVDPQSKNLDHYIENYFKILQETLQRDKFYGHSISFYKNMIEKLPALSKMYLAEFEDSATKSKKTVAGIIVTFYKDTAIYYYGASSNEYRNLMAPYLLQWTAIQAAKSKNLTKYDFLGISHPTEKDPLGPKNHPWRGVTEFKLKFGGKVVNYLSPQEYSFKPVMHSAYKVTRTISKKLRSLKKK